MICWFSCTGRSDRVTRSIKSLVFKSRQSWKILVKLRVFIQRIVKPLIILSLLFHGVFPVSAGNWVHPGEFASSGIFVSSFSLDIHLYVHTHFPTPFLRSLVFFLTVTVCGCGNEKKENSEFILFPDICPLYFALLFFLVWIISVYYYFRILIGCTHAKMFLFLSFLSLIICSSWNLFSLWAEWKNKTLTHIS